MHLPEALLDSLERVDGFDREAFVQVHSSGEQVTSIRVNPAKLPSYNPLLAIETKVPWSGYGYYLTQRPSFTFDPLFHAGCYYVQEASGMFLEQALKQTVDLSQPLKVLDLCASPGGKSTHIQSLISADSLLVSNEVIRSRSRILKDNMVKWGASNVVVSSNDPVDFLRLENYFDLIVVDAPCSGSGLFRRDEQAIDEWSPANVALCSQRQQRILADVWPALKENGVLIYATCSYSPEENEEILDWVTREMPVNSCQLALEDDWNIQEVQSAAGMYGYRFFPDKLKGEGFFLACLRKTAAVENVRQKIKSNKERLNKSELEIVKNWANIEELDFVRHENIVYGWPAQLHTDFDLLVERLHVLYSGTVIGELIRDKLIPAHALAMTPLVRAEIPRNELGYDEAIAYLQKKEWTSEPGKTGWQVVTYLGQQLGWVKVLANRVNNYYPMELRILKEN